MMVAQALEDHSIRHTRILEALEAEKQKIAKEVQTLQQSQSHRDKGFPSEWVTTSAQHVLSRACSHIVLKG